MSLKQLLLEAPEEHLDKSMKPLIEKWSNPPKSLEVLEVLDKCVYWCLASTLSMTVLESMYDGACVVECKAHEDNEPLASWRKEFK